MAGVSLQEKGWFLSEEGVAQCTSAGKSDTESIIKIALNTDLREIGKGWLPEDMNRGRADYVQGPGVLQLQKIRNVSAPKDNEDSQTAPRLMKLVLTDGHITCSAVETEVLRDVGSNTAPGSKILLKMTVDVEHGFLLLNNKNMKNLGGRVEKLAEGWELKKKLAKQQRSMNYGTEGGPPPFVPFGQRIGNDAYKPSTRRDNFKSLETNKADSKKAEDKEFEEQRKATIAEALQAKEDAQSKKFGGGPKQVSTDYDVAKITEMGFKAEEATTALKNNNGNVQQAIDYLLSGGSRDRRPQGGPNRQSEYDSWDRRPQGGPVRQSNYDSGDRRSQGAPNKQSSYESGDRRPQGVPNRQSTYESDRGRGRRDRREDDAGAGRGRRGRDTDEGDDVSSKPSAPSTLFDFLKLSNKIPDTKGTPEKRSYNDSSDKNHFANRERTRTSSGSSDQSNRSKQTVPPRFVNKPKYEQQGQNRGQGDRSDRPQRLRDDRPKTAPTENQRYDNRTQIERDRNFTDRDRTYSDRNNTYNDRSYNNDNRDFRGNRSQTDNRNFKHNDARNFKHNDDRNFKQNDDKNFKQNDDKNFKQTDNRNITQNDDRNFKQYDKRNASYNSRSNSSINQRETDGGETTRGNEGTDEASIRENHQPSSDGLQKSQDTILNNSSTSSRTSCNDKGEQDQSQNNLGQNSLQPDSRQNKPNANSYKQDTYTKGGNSQKSQSNLGANNHGSHVPNFHPGGENFVQSQQALSSNYRHYNNYPPMNSNAGQFHQPTEFIFTEAQQQPVQFNIKIGDKVMAKYWEDSLYYEAAIEVMAPNMPTVVVTFLEYGNTEEVLLSDIRPYLPQMMSQPGSIIATDISVPPPQVFYSAPPAGASNVDEVIQAFGGMEFRRGGGGSAYTRKDNRGQQQFYQPPAQRR